MLNDHLKQDLEWARIPEDELDNETIDMIKAKRIHIIRDICEARACQHTPVITIDYMAENSEYIDLYELLDRYDLNDIFGSEYNDIDEN